MSQKPKEPSHELGQQARQRYLDQARTVIGESDLSYTAVYQRFAQNDWAAMQLDKSIAEAALKNGISAKEVVETLHQGPYIQYQVHQKKVPKQVMTQYAKGLVIQELYKLQQRQKTQQPNRQQQTGIELE
ncbi:MAG: hypothetical protein MUF49_26465 [Oculatellaceae cyanobacterium Prado106]|nr:hypothetical protein [Oculatellaceae cyanobacterium Prado106]